MEVEVETEEGVRDMAAESVLQVWDIHRAREVEGAAASEPSSAAAVGCSPRQTCQSLPSVGLVTA